MPIDPELFAALSAAVEASPTSPGLRVHLARALLEGDQAVDALEAAVGALALDPTHVDALSIAASAASACGDPRAAGYQRLLGALRASPDSTPPPASPSHEEASSFEAIIEEEFGAAPSPGPVTPEFVRSEWEIEEPTVTLADVAGMEDVKRRLELGFLAGLRNPEIMQAFGMTLRGGLLLFGPPGCGKTYIAKATAGELGSRFLAVGLSDVLNMWLGESERRLHEIFEEARRNSPCVLFFDELDAIGQRRSHLRNAPSVRNVVNQLLAELDGVAASNAGVFILGATNHPWDVDTALRRPGRFDRLMLVLPPDPPAREAIIRANLDHRPVQDVDPAWLAAQTDEFSGADLVHLCTTAAEGAMGESLEAGRLSPIGPAHVAAALKEVHPSTRPWFEIAKNYAQFANEGGTYDDLLAYVRRHRI